MPLATAHFWQFLLILVIVLLVFGASRLPALAKSLGQSARVFRDEIRQADDEPGSAAEAPRATDAPRPANPAGERPA
jgi:sec-independent protein translocase protein TatA